MLISSPELKDLPPASHFPPSEIMSEVDAKFESARDIHRLRSLGASVIEVLGIKIPDCPLRCKGEGYECYEYVDDTWENLPPYMEDSTIYMTGLRIGEYTKQANMKRMRILFHGGEPLFIRHIPAAEYYDNMIDLLEESARSVHPELELEYAMHTNAILLTKSTMEMIGRRNINVSCSIDGNEEAQNRNRKTKVHGLGSFRATDKAIRRFASSEQSNRFTGLLAVLDLRNDPIETYEALCSYQPKDIDFLLPYANWDNPPFVPEGTTSATPYADWLLTVYHRWMDDRRAGKPVPDIRQFRSIINLSRGAESLTEALGMLTSQVAFIRSDGSFEGLDALKMTSRDEVETNMNVRDNTLEEVAQYFRDSGKLGVKQLSTTCVGCPVVDVCGGGHVESRYAAENGFDNTSIYCADLKKLIKEITSTTNAAYRDIVAKKKLQSIRSADNTSIPLDAYPLYSPLALPPKRSLATRIRPAELSDVIQITDLHGEAFFANYHDIIDPNILEDYISNDLLPRKYRYWANIIESMQQPHAKDSAFVATLVRKTIGFFALQETTTKDKLILNAHYESPRVENYGVGTEMLIEAERIQRQPVDIALQVVTRSKQAEFFVNHGYQPIVRAKVETPILHGIPLPQTAMRRPANTRRARIQRYMARNGLTEY